MYYNHIIFQTFIVFKLEIYKAVTLFKNFVDVSIVYSFISNNFFNVKLVFRNFVLMHIFITFMK